MKYFNSFDSFMESFKDRHQEWFEGPGGKKAVEGPRELNVVRLKDVVSNVEGVDWKLKAAGEEEPWDAQEPTDD